MAFNTPRYAENGGGESVRSTFSSPFNNSEESNLTSRSLDPNVSLKHTDVPKYLDKRCQSCNEIYGSGKNSIQIPDNKSDIVPPLDLKSEENYPNGGDCTFSYRKHWENAKIERKPEEAYETWLSAKKKHLSIQAARRREIEEQKRQELEERKRLSQEKYNQWLQNKAKLQKKVTTQLNERSCEQKSKNTEKVLYCELNNEEIKSHLDEWERTKRLQEERRRLKKQEQEQRRREVEEQRRRAAAEAWEKWLAEAAKKPKPVPLNRGIYTLRGTVSNIFVNPNEWKPILSGEKGDH
ncbi:uncharacterized protein LOC142229045 isoform X2 [Haematobia irritans]|uniref:uncharacterized protein LOC142229045 isoform X2 n=1 Tax=Haematobia irritans TaxID=7368 RepID=UPI003F50AFD6